MITGIAVIGIVSAMISSWVIDQVNVRPHPVIPAPAVGEDGGASPSANASTHDAGGCPDEDYTTGDEDIIDAPDRPQRFLPRPESEPGAIQNRAGGTAAAHRFGESSAQRDRTAASRGTQAHASLGADRAQIEMAREPQRAYASPRLPRRRQTGIVATRHPLFAHLFASRVRSLYDRRMTDVYALQLQPGDVVGGYTLESRLGSGAMGSVWRALTAEAMRMR